MNSFAFTPLNNHVYWHRHHLM